MTPRRLIVAGIEPGGQHGAMPMNVNRWLKYAKAKLDDTLASGNDELERLEARQEADRADKPWIGSEGDAPTFDEARARIAWEAERAAADKRVEPTGPGPERDTSDTSAGSDTSDTSDTAERPVSASESRSPGLPTDPRTAEEAAERSAAQIVLDQQAAESAARLAAIRAELGVDDPEPPTP